MVFGSGPDVPAGEFQQSDSHRRVHSLRQETEGQIFRRGGREPRTQGQAQGEVEQHLRQVRRLGPTASRGGDRKWPGTTDSRGCLFPRSPRLTTQARLIGRVWSAYATISARWTA